jgi:glycolate oxidase FAD binding subunit
VNRFVPASLEEACDIVRAARSDSRALQIAGGGTRAGLGRPVQADDVLSSAGLSGILVYEPAEMVIRARSGTPLEEVEAALAGNNQMLPFEPVDHRPLYGSQGRSTIGALAACNISGPRRIRAGAARDSLIGVRFVNGAGEELSSGGRVMKNVTGLDLVKLQAGAYGTIGFLTEVTFKLLPKPECTGTLVIEGLSGSDAIRAMSLASQSPFEVSAAAHVPACEGRVPQTAIRVEHFRPSVDYRLREIAKRLAEFGASRMLDTGTSLAFWADVRDATVLGAGPADIVWRISIRPSHTAAFLAALRTAGLAFRYMLDHGGGLIWLALPPCDNAGADIIRQALPAGVAHALLARAPDATRASVPVFQPLPDAMMKLTAGIKTSMDAGGIFNPGRMYDGV